MAEGFIKIGGAREHNLKNLTLSIPRDRLVVITGLSGSGKSSLAFDTIYAEGQRKYVESLSAYARQFLDQMQKPEVDFIEGLSPAIAIEQRSSGTSPRSIIATTTEIYDYLRLLFANVGQPHCPVSGEPIVAQTTSDIVDRILALPPKTRLMLLAPVVREQKGEFRDVVERLGREGFVRARIDGELMELASNVRIKLDAKQRHSIEAVVDRLVIDDKIRVRLGRFGGDGAPVGGGAVGGVASARRIGPANGLDRDVALEPELQPGDRLELRAADAETFLVQFAGGRVSGLSRVGAKARVRRRAGGA